MDESKILCMVGDELRVIDHDVFLAAHEQLADRFRALVWEVL